MLFALVEMVTRSGASPEASRSASDANARDAIRDEDLTGAKVAP